MWGFDSIRSVSVKIGEIGKTVQNDASAKLKQYAPDSEKVRPALRSLAGELAKELLVTKVPGGRWLWKSLKRPVQEIQSAGSSSGELKDSRKNNSGLERANSSLEETRERISRFERENEEIKERISKLEGDFSIIRSRL